VLSTPFAHEAVLAVHAASAAMLSDRPGQEVPTVAPLQLEEKCESEQA
jgi:hypothetical protein